MVAVGTDKSELPKAPPWFVHLVNDVSEKYGVTVKVSPSELVEEPFF
jgi:hypothetical protein